VGLAALLFLHHEPQWGTAAAAVGLGALVTAAMRSVWGGLPRFVTRWLDGGVFIVAVLVVTASTGLTHGLPYAVLRWPRTLALFGAAGLMATVVGGLAYTHLRLEAEVRLAAERLHEARRRALESRLTALSAQINPHFLFNTLNTLAEVVHEDEDQAEDLVSDLASMMRYALDSSSKRVTLAEEFQVIRRLLNIERARLGERLRCDFELDPAVQDVRIPGLLVQPLVENAVRHACSSRIEGGTVRVSASRVGDRVEIRVEDDGPGIPPSVLAELEEPLDDDSHPGGLRNVLERVRLAWSGDSAQLSFPPRESGSTLLLTLPLESE